MSNQLEERIYWLVFRYLEHPNAKIIKEYWKKPYRHWRKWTKYANSHYCEDYTNIHGICICDHNAFLKYMCGSDILFYESSKNDLKGLAMNYIVNVTAFNWSLKNFSQSVDAPV